MTKVEAIIALMEEYGGIITLELLYNEITKFYPNARKSVEWKAGLRGVLYREVGKLFKKIDTSTYALINYDKRNLVSCDDISTITEKEIMLVVRTQQNKFRKNLLKHLKYCPITFIKDRRLLVASHIKPWCISNSAEKLDINNGFVFSPLYDKLFDRGLITFSLKKELVISPSLSEDTIKKLNIQNKVYSALPVEGREEYLKFHNEKIFVRS